MRYKVGDIVRQYTSDRCVSWRGVVQYVGPRSYDSTSSPNKPYLDDGYYWIQWDNGSSNRVQESIIEFDKEYLRSIQLGELGI